MHYIAKGWSKGIAWYIAGHPTIQEECQGHPDDGIMNGPMGETFYCDGSCEEPYEDETRVIAIMVGDDREFIFDADELVEIPEDSFCRDCGQVGCGHNTYE